MSLLSDLVPLGTSGYSGVSGYSGSSGTSGYSGSSGAAGGAGEAGTSGYSGLSGTSGYSGPSGTSGTSAYSGKSGTSGYSGSAGTTPTTIDITVTAGEALSARDCVYIAPVAGGGFAGRAYKADADAVRSSTQGFWCGFATAAISAAATGTVRVAGILTGFTLTAGAPQYISATAGAITETLPTNARIVGIALDTTNLLINTRGANTTVSKAGVKGYVLSTTAADCYIITYATDTSAAQTSLVEGTSNQAIGISEGITKGYVAGAALAYKYTFSTNTSAASTASILSSSRLQLASMMANNAKGYFLGGTPGPSAVTDKLTYSTDTTAASTASILSSARNGARSVAQFNSHGYTAGGNTGAYVATTDKTTFSSDVTAAATTANLSEVKDNLGGVSEGNTKGYFAGGNTADASNCSVIADKVTYSNDTTAAATTANLLVGRAWFATNSEGSTKGYWHAGYTNSLTYASTAQTDKTTFSTDVTAAATTANVTSTGWLSGMSDVAI